MFLIHDTKNDKGFRKAIKIILLFCIAFIIADALLGFSLTKGLNLYYGLNADARIALVGHSHLMLGVDKSLLEKELKVPVAKYTREGVNIADREVMIKQLLQQNTGLRYIVYEIDAWSFTGEGLSANSYTLFYPFLGSREVDEYVKSQAGFGDYWLHKIIQTSRFNELLISSSFRGYLNNWSNLKFGTVDTVRIKKEIQNGDFRKIKNSPDNIAILKRSLSILKEKNIKVVLLYVPTIDFYNVAEPNKFKETMDIFNAIKKEFSNVTLLNYNEPFSHDYTLFYDPIHMNPKGQHEVTMQLVKDLQTMF